MNVRKIVIAARKSRARISDVYLILTLVEIDALDTPFFSGLDDEELIYTLLSYIHVQEREFYLNCILNPLDEGPCYPGFFEFLVDRPELNFNLDKLKYVYNAIQKEGEENYEFNRIDRVDKKDAGHQGP